MLDGHAAGERDRPAGARLLPRDELLELAVHLLLGVGAHRAADQHGDVGIVERDIGDETDLRERLGQALVVGVVHLATDVPQVHPRWAAQARHDGLPRHRRLGTGAGSLGERERLEARRRGAQRGQVHGAASLASPAWPRAGADRITPERHRGGGPPHHSGAPSGRGADRITPERHRGGGRPHHSGRCPRGRFGANPAAPGGSPRCCGCSLRDAVGPPPLPGKTIRRMVFAASGTLDGPRRDLHRASYLLRYTWCWVQDQRIIERSGCHENRLLSFRDCRSTAPGG